MFIILPVGVNYSARRYPVVTFTIMGLCTAVFLFTFGGHLWRGETFDESVLENLWLTPAMSHWWTYLTSMFVHEGILHIVGNMIFLFLFGSAVEDMIGRVRYAVFYLTCGIVAELAYIAMIPDHFASNLPMGGASGAISGCIGGFMLLLLKTEVQFKYFGWIFFRPFSGDFELKAWLVVSFWFLKDLAMLILTRHSSGGGVAFGAHVGGTLCGLGLIGLEKLRVQLVPIAPTRAAVVAQVAESQDIFLFMNGAQIGPFSLSQIRGMFVMGSIAGGTVYWKDGMPDWRAAEELQ